MRKSHAEMVRPEMPADAKTFGAVGAADANGSVEEPDYITPFRNGLVRQAIWALCWGGVTVVVGIAIMMMAHGAAFPMDELSSEVTRDLGISVVIAGLVGIFYETFTHWFGRVEAKVQTEVRMRRLLDLSKKIEALLKQATQGDDPIERVKSILEIELTPTPKYTPLIKNLERLLREIFSIHEIGNKLRVKEIEEYIELIAWILEKYTVRGAAASRRALEGLLDIGDTVCSYAPYELRAFILKILASQMRAMRAGDQYDSLANIWLYANMSKNYIETTREALASGVGIRRIFNLSNVQSGSRAQNTDATLALIKAHIKQFEGDGFAYRFMTDATLRDLAPTILEAAGVPDEESVRTMYFGHFHHVQDKKMLRFVSKSGTDMTSLDLTIYSTGNVSPDYEAKAALFEHFWEKSKSVPLDSIDTLKDECAPNGLP